MLNAKSVYVTTVLYINLGKFLEIIREFPTDYEIYC
jgi:hypothetical protein